MKFADLKQHIQDCKTGKGSFAPLYCVYGDDDCLVRKAVKEFEGIVDSDYADFNLAKIKDEQDVQSTIDALDTFPMFDEYKVVVLTLQNPLSKSKKLADGEGENEVGGAVKDALDAYMTSPSPTSVLVVECKSKDVASSVKFKGAQSVDCSKLDDETLAKEIRRIAQEPPSRDIDEQAIRELTVRTQSSMGRIESEMVKLKSYVDERITYNDVCDMVVADLDYKMYELANAVSQKKCDEALKVLNVFFENGLRGATVLTLLYGKYRELLHVGLNKNMPNDDLAKLLGMSKGGAVYYLKQIASGYSQVRLKNCVDYLHELQYQVLSGKRNENSAVHEAVLNLMTI